MGLSNEAAAGLVESLERGSEELSALLDLTERERHSLVQSDHEAFAACAEEKQEALTRFMRRQDEIAASIARAGRELGLAAGGITLSAIRESVPEPSRARVSALAGEIEGRMADLRDTNLRNAELLKRALAYYDFLAGLILEAFTEHPEYGPRPKGEAPHPIMMDRRA
jgi:flagellar biosynthesis/type III secretory pathway chaperone